MEIFQPNRQLSQFGPGARKYAGFGLFVGNQGQQSMATPKCPRGGVFEQPIRAYLHHDKLTI